MDEFIESFMEKYHELIKLANTIEQREELVRMVVKESHVVTLFSTAQLQVDSWLKAKELIEKELD